METTKSKTAFTINLGGGRR